MKIYTEIYTEITTLERVLALLIGGSEMSKQHDASRVNCLLWEPLSNSQIESI